MIREYPNGDKAEIKGLTVTVELGEESIGRIRKAALDEIDSLKAENAKLRELAVEVFKCAKRGAACETCKVNNDGYACVYIMRELGIEVS